MEKQNKMGTEPIPRLLRSMAYPMILSYFVNAIYNVVDSLFVSYLTVPGIENASDKAVTALSLAFPIQMLICPNIWEREERKWPLRLQEMQYLSVAAAILECSCFHCLELLHLCIGSR